MKLVHLSDLHLGKKLRLFELEEDQRVIMKQIQDYLLEEKPDAVVIAGDIYDVGHQPPAWAVKLYGEFLGFLRDLNPQPEVFIIAGNHDSAERLAFASELFGNLGIHISKPFSGAVEVVTVNRAGMEDVCFYLFPYVQPYQCGKDKNGKVRETYDEAVGSVLDTLVLDPEKRHIMITHQYVDVVEGQIAELRESERYIRGGTEVISVERFLDFEYVALGHLHAPQSVKYPYVRYCGTPLAYSLSEEGDTKSLTVVEIGEKEQAGQRAEVEVRELILDAALRRVCTLSGMSEDFMDLDHYEEYHGDFVYFELQDKQRTAGMGEALRKRFPYNLGFEYSNIQPLGLQHQPLAHRKEDLGALDMFRALYSQQLTVDQGEATTLVDLVPEQVAYLEDCIAKIWGDET